MIKYINNEINEANYKNYFEEVNIAGDGNCGVYSIIYAMNKHTNIETYKKYQEMNNGHQIYYNQDAVQQFRQEIYHIYDKKIKEPNITATIKSNYQTRQRNILTDGEWLEDADIQFYGEFYGLCIVGFETGSNKFYFISTSQIDKHGFDGCTNTIFLINHGSKQANGQDKEVYRNSSTGVHFQVLVPKTGAQIYRNVFIDNDQVTYIDDYGPYANDVNSSASSRNSPVPVGPKSPFPVVPVGPVVHVGLNSRRVGPNTRHSSRNRQLDTNAENLITGRNTRRNRPGKRRPTRNEGPSTNLLLGSLSVLIMITIISLQ